MANSWGFDGSQLYPPLMDPWCKIQLGWVTPTVLTETSRSIEIKPSYTEDDYYVIQKGFPQGEYLVIENRRRVGYDSQIPRVGFCFVFQRAIMLTVEST
jgi:M6 family metalloprotease-like protein